MVEGAREGAGAGAGMMSGGTVVDPVVVAVVLAVLASAAGCLFLGHSFALCPTRPQMLQMAWPLDVNWLRGRLVDMKTGFLGAKGSWQVQGGLAKIQLATLE